MPNIFFPLIPDDNDQHVKRKKQGSLYKPEEIIIHSDDQIVVVNKPTGLLSLPDRYDPGLPYMQKILEPVFGRLWIVHRLDKETSGVMILARNAEAHKMFSRQFASREAQKVYQAIIIGVPEWQEKMIDLPLLIDSGPKHRTVISEKRGKPARTLVKILEKYNGFCFAEVQPRTGYTHQIRAHLAYTGHPVLMDDLYAYGNRQVNDSFPIKRLFLHASSITLQSSVDHSFITFKAELPKEFIKALRCCRKRRK